MVDDARAQAKPPSKGLEFNYSVNPDVPNAVIGDPQRFDQVLHNLVGNAIKFTDRGEVMVHVTSSENTDSHVTIRCAVKDTGRGIPAGSARKTLQAALRSAILPGTNPAAVWRRPAAHQRHGRHPRHGKPAGPGLDILVHRQGAQAAYRVADPHDEDRPMISGTEGLRVLVVDDNATNLHGDEGTARGHENVGGNRARRIRGA
jgi:two-component system sensor histidine kinase/response regulator